MADEPTTVTMRPTISAAWADTMISAAIAKAAASSVAVTVVVVDESGVVKSMTRMDGAPLVSVQTGINKAYGMALIAGGAPCAIGAVTLWPASATAPALGILAARLDQLARRLRAIPARCRRQAASPRKRFPCAR